MAHLDLTGRSAVITGGSMGIGLAIAEAFVDAGARLTLLARGETALQSARARIGGSNVRTAMCDVRDESALASATSAHVEAYGGMDVLVNSAGINVRGAIEDVAADDFRRCLDVNITGTWLACRAAGPALRESDAGTVINLASALGCVGAPERSAYCASKGAIVQLSRALAIEWAPAGVTVNALAPGIFMTPMNEDLDGNPVLRKLLAEEVPAGRMGELTELAAVAVLLASDAASRAPCCPSTGAGRRTEIATALAGTSLRCVPAAGLTARSGHRRMTQR